VKNATISIIVHDARSEKDGVKNAACHHERSKGGEDLDCSQFMNCLYKIEQRVLGGEDC